MLLSHGSVRPTWRARWKQEKQKQHLYDEMRSLIWNMTLIGGWPIRHTDTGFKTQSWISGTKLWSYFVAVIEAVTIVACVRNSFGRLTLESLAFEEKVILILHLIYETAPISVPLIHWHTGRRLAKYFNEWSRLQSTWIAVTGTPLQADSCRYARWVGVPICIWSILSTLYHTSVVPDMFLWKVPLYSMVVMQLVTQSVLWGALHREIAATSDKLRVQLRQSVRCAGDARRVRGCCGLWLRLHSLTCSLGTVWGPVMLHCMLLTSLMGLTACFGLLAALRMRVLRRCLSTAITIICAATINVTACSSVQRSITRVSQDLRNEILSTPLYLLPLETARELMLFTRVIQSKPIRFTLNGLVVIDRRFAISIASTVTTYIVVLAQLAITLQSADEQ